MDSFTPSDQALFEMDLAIARSDFYTAAVLDKTPWAYTVGLLKTLQHPELIVFGLSPDAGHGGLSAVVDEIRSGRVHLGGRERPFTLNGVSSCLIPVLEEYWKYPCDYLLGASHYYAATGASYDPRALQLVWADEQGHFPWNPKFSSDLSGRQPLLDRRGAFSPEPWMDRCTWS